MQIAKLKVVLLLLCCLALAFEVWHLRSRGSSDQRQVTQAVPKHGPNFALLPATEIDAYAGLFGDPKPRMENWEPTVEDINDLEASLKQISALSGQEQDTNRHIDDPSQYFRQYLAVAVKGKKIIFVNAMCRIEPGKYWRKLLIVAMDGGKCFWHAEYDPATQAFSNLKVNGSL